MTFQFEWVKCEECGYECMWAKLPGVPDRALHYCQVPKFWTVTPAAVEED